MTVNKCDIQHNVEDCYAQYRLCSVSFVLSVTFKNFMLSVIMLNVIKNVIMLNIGMP